MQKMIHFILQPPNGINLALSCSKPNVKKLDSVDAFNEINNPNIHVVIQALTPNLFIVSPKNHECGTIQTCAYFGFQNLELKIQKLAQTQ
jgi:hypothetical protein